MTTSEAAKAFGVSAKTLRRWDASGKFPASRNYKGERVYSPQDLESFHPIQNPQASSSLARTDLAKLVQVKYDKLVSCLLEIESRCM